MTVAQNNASSDQYDKNSEGVYQELITTSDKYLCFSLNTELYGFELRTVQEIIRDLAITRVPNSPHYLTGVANLRGKVTPIVDLAKKIHSGQREERSPWIVVLEVQRGDKKSQVGIMVDGLPEVVTLPENSLQKRTEQGGAAEFVIALGRADDKVVLVLDAAKLVSDATGFTGEF